MALLPALVTAGHAETLARKTTHMVFDIIRQGDKIGTNSVDIDKQGDTTKVRIETSIHVKVMFIEAYRYEHVCDETWKGEQLIAFASKTDDNGTPHRITFSMAGDRPSLDVDGTRKDVPKDIVPASLWSRTLLHRPDWFNPANGQSLRIAFHDLGEDQVQIHGAAVKAHHYKISAQGSAFDRDLWFDGDNVLRIQLQGSDNSTIISDRR
ncbi:DUF6134 family protein [Beijerinckia indica]|nr:DUF6134 family protein [Beijerinckia indica]